MLNLLQKKCYWTDSKISLCWIKNTRKEWKQWVENRVNKIRSLSQMNEWFYIPGHINPADIPTREIDILNFSENHTWWKGPEFLFHGNIWPDQGKLELHECEMKIEVETELRARNILTNFVNSDHTPDGREVMYEDVNLNDLIIISRYSTLTKVLRVTSYVLRFIHNMKKDVQGRTGVLSIEELSERLWIKSEQRILKTKRQYLNMEKQLNLFNEKGILKVRGRFGNSSLSHEFKHPVLLDRESWFTKLVVLNAHEKVKHMRANATLNEVRSRYWICRGRQVINQIIKPCTVCKYIQSKVLQGPPSPDLPSYRIASEFAFTKIGLDHAGPILVKNIYFSNNDMHKAYICLFTCASTRNIHLELTPNLGSAAMIRGLKRFIARRGVMELVISDNFKTFMSKDIEIYLSKEGIKWHFILPKAPWWGGFYERLIRVVKECLRKSLGKAKLTYEELETSLLEVEMVINSRPLTYINNEPNECPHTIPFSNR